MSQKRTLEQRLWRWSLMLHGLIFTLYWALSFYTLAFTPFYNNYSSLPVIVLLWIPFLIAHVAAYLHYKGRPNTVELERQAYRDGFADGMRERSNVRGDFDARRLSVENETELVDDMPEPGKRKRELQ